jgi:HlyD family secretion protein
MDKKKKTIIIIVSVVIVLAVAAFFVVNRARNSNAANSEFETVTLENGELVAYVGATGTVRANQTAQLTWQTSGRIENILVELDQEVPVNGVLADLAQNSLPQSIILSEAELFSAKKALETLQDSDSARAAAQLNLAQAQIAYNDAVENRGNLDYARASENTLDGLRADLILAQDAVDQAESQYGWVEDSAEDDPNRAFALSQLSQARKNRDRAVANLNYALSKPDPEDVEQADAQVDVALAQLEDAQREVERLKDGVDPEEVAAAEARVAAIEATLSYKQLEAPFAGTVTQINSKVGDQVSPGTLSFRLDDTSRLLVDIDIPEVDINQVQVDQPVRMNFDAIMGDDFEGKVTEVANVGTSSPNGVNFRVTVEIAREVCETCDIRPGMTAGVNIVVERLQDVLLVPNRAVRFEEGKRVIYLLRENGMPEAVEIEIGGTADVYSQLIGGDVKEGDLVVLNPPRVFNPPGPMGQ